MDFQVYQSADNLFVLVPALFELPHRARRDFTLSPVGRVAVDLNDLSGRAVAQLGIEGFAIASQEDARLVRLRLALDAEAVGTKA